MLQFRSLLAISLDLVHASEAHHTHRKSMTTALSLLSIVLVVAAMSLASAATLRPPTMLCAAQPHKRRQKTVHLHDIARNDSRNEYFAGGQDDEGRGSATVLIYPDEEDANETKVEEEPPEPVEKFKGSGRKL